MSLTKLNQGIKWGWLVVILSAAACTQKVDDQSPIKVLESYIEISFNAKSIDAKKKMEALLTGDTQQRLMSWSEDQFIKAFVEVKRKFLSIKILENKPVHVGEHVITYELTFKEGEGDQEAKVSQRKLATIVKESDAWRIKEVRSLRESIEYLKELSLP